MSERAQALEALRQEIDWMLGGVDGMDSLTISAAILMRWRRTLQAPAEGVSPQPEELLSAYAKALACVKAERDELQALAGAILRSVRDDEHGEQWTIRKFLDDRGVYNDNLSGSRRLVEEACKKVIGGYDAPPVSPAPVCPVEPTAPQREEAVYRSGFQAGQRYAGADPNEMDNGIVLLISAASAASGYLERQQPDLAARLWDAVQRVRKSQLAPVEPTPEPPQERKAYYAKVLEDEAGFVRYDAVSRAGENRVHLYGWRLNGTQVGLGYIRRRPDNTIELTEERAPTVEPAPCVWRKSPETGLWKTTCDVPAIFNAPSSRWKFCGFCGHPLTVKR